MVGAGLVTSMRSTLASLLGTGWLSVRLGLSVAEPTLGIGSPLPRAAEHGSCIYLDYQATTPIWREVAEAASPFLSTHWGNPSSAHAFGRPCAAAICAARAAVAALIGAQPNEILFTSCGSEADNHAIVGAVKLAEAAARAAGRQFPLHPPPHVVTTNAEHPAVERCLAALQAEGRCDATYVPVGSDGLVSADAVAAALRPETVLVTVMHANNEVGSINPVGAISAVVRARCPGALIHTDAAQSVGKIPVNVNTLGVHLLTLVGHKLGAPKGVAALYVRDGLHLPNLLHGGGQEAGRRAGTESVLLLVALGKACQIAAAELPATSRHMEATRGRLAQLLVEGLGGHESPDAWPVASPGKSHDTSQDTSQDRSRDRSRGGQVSDPADTSLDASRDGPSGVRIHGPADASLRLPNTLSIGLRGVRAAELLASLSERLAASAGAACHTGEAGVSPVLRAMGVPVEYAVGTLRLSTGRHTTMAEVEAAAQLIIGEAKRQRAGGQANLTIVASSK